MKTSKNFDNAKQQLLTEYTHLKNSIGRQPYLSELKEHFGISYDKVRWYFGNLKKLDDASMVETVHNHLVIDVKQPPAGYNTVTLNSPTQQEDYVKDSILVEYAELRFDLGRTPSIDEIKNHCDITSDKFKYYWGSIKKIDSEARTKYPNFFTDVKIKEIIDNNSLDKLQDVISKNKKFLITTAVVNSPIHGLAYDTIKSWENINNGKALFLIASDSNGTFIDGLVPSELLDESVITENVKLNSNIFLSTIKIGPKNIDPITGLNRIGQRHSSFIYASPKQRLKGVPVSNNSTPHFIMTTGAITQSQYNNTSSFFKKSAYLAEHDHVMGGIIVEVVDDKFFHFRQIQFSEDGSFIDFGTRYLADGTTELARPEAFVLGDWHSGDTCPMTRDAWKDVCNILQPKKLVMHDIFNGASINHHEENNIVLRAQHAQNGLLSLKSELEGLASDINDLCDWQIEELVIVKSNHDIFLDRYLKEARYAYDPQNHGVALKIADAAVNDNKDPLKFAIEELIGLDQPDKVNWLNLDDDLYVADIQLGSHGHHGGNGSRGNIRSMEMSYGKSISGHSHSPEILRNAWVVGTSTHLRLSYTHGGSSWLNSSCLLYKDGSRQLINSINGKYKL